MADAKGTDELVLTIEHSFGDIPNDVQLAAWQVARDVLLQWATLMGKVEK